MLHQSRGALFLTIVWDTGEKCCNWVLVFNISNIIYLHLLQKKEKKEVKIRLSGFTFLSNDLCINMFVHLYRSFKRKKDFIYSINLNCGNELKHMSMKEHSILSSLFTLKSICNISWTVVACSTLAGLCCYVAILY